MRETPKDRFLAEDELRKLLSALDGDPAHQVAKMILFTGVTSRALSRTAAVAMSRSMAPALRPERLSVPTILPYSSANASSG